MIPTSTDVSIAVKPQPPADVEATVVFLTRGAAEASSDDGVSREISEAVARLAAAGVAKGKTKEIHFDLIGSGNGKVRRVYVAGLGEAGKVDAEAIRQSAGAIAKALRKHRVGRAAIVPPSVQRIDVAEAAEAIITGLLLASFDYEEYKGTGNKKKGEDEENRRKPLAVTLIADARDAKAVKGAVDRARAIADGQNFCRTIASRPGNNINPPALAKVAQEMAREVGLKCTILDEKQMARLGMGGILAVGAGSINTPPRMIVLEHRGSGNTRMEGGRSRMDKRGSKAKGQSPSSPLLVVGKAITFDTGGISIKPADKMGKMIFDKCGGMAVLGLMYAAANLDLPVNIVGILSSAENAISSKAYRPGDILKMYNGVTVEVTNTDAEGRLVLGDALAWGIETYKPSAVVDLATLTGGVIVALGHTMAGLMTNSDELAAELQSAGEAAGEKMWRLPLGDEQREQMKSDPADIVNSAGRPAHPLQGGAFLSYFVPSDHSVPWAHLDIAGVADTEKDLLYYAKGATGWGVRTLVNWAASRAAGRTGRRGADLAVPPPAGG